MYDAALKEFEIAATASPNNADIYSYIGGIYRRQGRWAESIASFERARSPAPRTPGRALVFGASNNSFVAGGVGAPPRFLHRPPGHQAGCGLPRLGLGYGESCEIR